MDVHSRDALVLANEGLAAELSIVWDDRIEGHDRDDLAQECRLALTAAASAWDGEPGRFAPWARLCIETHLRRLRFENLQRTANSITR